MFGIIFAHELKPLTSAEPIVTIVLKVHGFGGILVAIVGQYPIQMCSFGVLSNDTMYNYVYVCVSTNLHMKHDIGDYKWDYATQRWMRLSLEVQ